MQNINTGSDNFDNDSVEMLEGLQQQRRNLLGTIVDIHVGLGLLASAEADRLAQKYGADDARTQLLRDRSEATASRVNALSVEQEIATVRTPAPPSTGALIQGRITDVTQRAAGNVSVQLVDQKGQPVPGVAPVEADDSGYFAIQLNAETVKAIGTDSKLVLLLRGADAQLVPAAVQPISIAPGATVMQSVPLSTAELERLRLRMAVAVRPVAMTPQVFDAPTVVDTAAANKAAVDKAAADKTAAEKAVAEKAAAEKATAEKTIADRAAADKAAADKAAAGKAATEKAAADKAAAEKAAAEKAAAEKAAADKAAASKPAPKTKSAKGKPAPHTPPAKPRGRTGRGKKR